MPPTFCDAHPNAAAMSLIEEIVDTVFLPLVRLGAAEAS
jgi:hypothetical protein